MSESARIIEKMDTLPQGSYQIRHARESDYRNLLELYKISDRLHYQGDPDFFCIPPQPPRSERYIKDVIKDERKTIILAESEEGKAVGLIELKINEFLKVSHTLPRREAFVVAIVFDQTFRGRGLGRRLLETALGWATENGAWALTGDVYTFNEEAAEIFIERLGAKIRYQNIFHKIQERENQYWQPTIPSTRKSFLTKIKHFLKRF